MTTLLFIQPGPTYYVNNELFKSLSNSFSGDILTFSNKKEIVESKIFHSFNFRCLDVREKKKFGILFRYIWHCLKFLLKKQFIQKQKIDLVITYDPLKTGLIGVLCSKVCGAKLLVEVNGVYTSSAVYADSKNKVEAKMKHLIYPITEKIVLSSAKGIKLLFPTQIDPLNLKTTGKMIRSYFCHVDVQPFLNYQIDLSYEEILFIGYPHYLKGVDILIKAFKMISSEFPTWKLKILGWYPDLSVITNAIDGHSQIYHHKPVFSNEVPNHMSKCSIFVLPSRSEAMGRVLVEAAAAGKARIGSNIEGIPTVIKNNVDGYLFNYLDPFDLSEKLTLLMADIDLRTRIGVAARDNVIKYFTHENYIHQTVDFYNDVIAL